MSAYSLALPTGKPAFTVTVPPTLYVAGSKVLGEVELYHELLYEDDIESVYVELQGTFQT